MKTKIICDIPLPPSVNGILIGRRSIRLSEGYRAWKDRAGVLWLTQRQNQPRAISGAFRAILLIHFPENLQNRKVDLDNRIKAALDFAVSMRLVEDDSLCQALYARLATKEEAPTGCRLILRQHQS